MRAVGFMVGLIRYSCREGDSEYGSFAGLAFSIDAAFITYNKVGNEHQTKTGSGFACSAGKRGVALAGEKLLKVFFFNANSVIADFNQRLRLTGLHLNDYSAACIRKLYRIRQ